MKQETLEEASLKIAHMLGKRDTFEIIKDVFCYGAKWQKERSYSEEEVLELLKMYRNSIVEVNPVDIVYLDKWFEQFKKK